MSARPDHYNRYVREYRTKHKAAGLCLSCSRPAIRAARCELHWASEDQRRRVRYTHRRRKKLCVSCAQPKGPGRYVQCAACRKEKRERRTPWTATTTSLRGAMSMLTGTDRIDNDELAAFWKTLSKQSASWLRPRSKTERRIVRARLLGPQVSLRALGEEMGCSYEWIRQVEMQLAAELKVWLAARA